MARDKRFPKKVFTFETMLGTIPSFLGDGSNLKDPDDLLIDVKTITIKVEYPLEDEARFEYVSKDGFTRQKLFRCICDAYRKVYRAPKKYGIWGHTLGDLVLSMVTFDGKKNLVELSVDS